jgi:hypothetical protein
MKEGTNKRINDLMDRRDMCMGGRMEKCGLKQTLCWNMIDVKVQGRQASLTGVGESCVGRDELCCSEVSRDCGA